MRGPTPATVRENDAIAENGGPRDTSAVSFSTPNTRALTEPRYDGSLGPRDLVSYAVRGKWKARIARRTLLEASSGRRKS